MNFSSLKERALLTNKTQILLLLFITAPTLDKFKKMANS